MHIAMQRMRAVLTRAAGRQGTPSLFLSEAPIPQVRQGQILVKVGAAGVNRMDLMQKAGKYPPPQGATDILGPEAAGVVVSGSTFPYGTPVACLLPGGGYAEYVAASPELCFPIPSNLTVEEAACIPENWITAYQLLQEVGGLTDFPANGGKPSGVKSILVYAAASGVGVALLQIIRAFLPGAKVLAVAGTPEKLQCAENLGAAVSLNYKLLGDTLGDEALKRTDGQGVDLVLDCVGASLWEQTVVVDRTFGAEEAEEAHQRLQESANIGKVVIILDRAIASLHGTP
ncbi:quinone oxidoreductase pig3 isoform x1 [Cyclospora cayetanensis]|uniref:Quinone oxidoreductase pig3 isoform x1 n=1 Tax=Cyclospora cayetanensis TaxID=88456 RepID=A0A1D3CZ22_9EIME|nr:quinone oxidoreductase pig3 isoform x1 [Cyclospora cayetanensis]